MKRILLAALAVLGIGSSAAVFKPNYDQNFLGALAPMNYVANPSARSNANSKTSSGASLTRDTSTANIDGVASWTCDGTAQNDYCEWTLNTINAPDDSGNCQFSGVYYGDATKYDFAITDGSGTTLASTALGSSSGLLSLTSYGQFAINYPCGASGARKVRLIQTQTGNGAAVQVGRLYYGSATNVGSTSNGIWTSFTPTGSWVSNSTYTGRYRCTNRVLDVENNIALSGAPTSAALTINLPSGFIVDTANLTSTVANYSPLRGSGRAIDSGNNGYFAVPAYTSTGAIAVMRSVGLETGSFAQISVANDVNATAPFTFGNADSVAIQYSVPVTSCPGETIAVGQNNYVPLVTTYTSGSGTYTVPPGTIALHIKIVGGGGGGGGSGTGVSATSGTTGGTSTFGSVASCTGGQGGQGASGGVTGGAGGTCTISGASGVPVDGTRGSDSFIVPTTLIWPGANGGGTLFGGGGTGQYGGTGRDGITNTGGGGAGGGSQGASSVINGTGGGGGGGFDGWITSNIASSYSYCIGNSGGSCTGGGGGAAGTSGRAGGAGAVGKLEITAFPSTMAPFLVGSVLYSDTVRAGGSNGVNSVAATTYTPTITNGTNISANTPDVCQYTRSANIVLVSCRASITCTAGGATASDFGVSLPVASNLAASADLNGSIRGTTDYGMMGADTTNDRAQASFNCNSTGAVTRRFDFAYKIN